MLKKESSLRQEDKIETQNYTKKYPYRKPTNASNDPFIVMSSQMLLHASAYQRHHQGAHMFLTSYLYVGVHYKKNDGVSNNIASVSIVTLWKWLTAAGSSASSSS
jgi:hypothetical protein